MRKNTEHLNTTEQVKPNLMIYTTPDAPHVPANSNHAPLGGALFHSPYS